MASKLVVYTLYNTYKKKIRVKQSTLAGSRLSLGFAGDFVVGVIVSLHFSKILDHRFFGRHRTWVPIFQEGHAHFVVQCTIERFNVIVSDPFDDHVSVVI